MNLFRQFYLRNRPRLSNRWWVKTGVKSASKPWSIQNNLRLCHIRSKHLNEYLIVPEPAITGRGQTALRPTQPPLVGQVTKGSASHLPAGSRLTGPGCVCLRLLIIRSTIYCIEKSGSCTPDGVGHETCYFISRQVFEDLENTGFFINFPIQPCGL